MGFAPGLWVLRPFRAQFFFIFIPQDFALGCGYAILSGLDFFFIFYSPGLRPGLWASPLGYGYSALSGLNFFSYLFPRASPWAVGTPSFQGLIFFSYLFPRASPWAV